MFNLGTTTKYLFENSNFHELMEATEEIPEMFDDLAWMGARTSMYQEPTTLEPHYTETPFHEDARETQNLLTAYLWASISDSGEFASELSEEEKMRTRVCLSVLVGLVVGILTGVGTSQFVHPLLGVTSGLTTAITTGSASAGRLDNWYDMKRRQRFPDDE